ncbi:MAG: aldo/keto reductase [Chloroflexi bacterium]|nr:aldo/keto reductase [Chloroflexota bacterium]
MSVLALGGGGIGGVYGRTSVDAAIDTVRAALDAGIDLIDVAPLYGDGLAESVVGAAIAGRRADVTLLTKVELPAGVTDVERFVDDSVRGSLERLGTDHLDILMIHNVLSDTPGRPHVTAIGIDTARRMHDALLRYRAKGIARWLAFSAWRCSEHVLMAMLERGFDVLQAEYSMFNQTGIRQADPAHGFGDLSLLEQTHDDASMGRFDFRGVDQRGVITRAAAAGMGVIGVRPLMAGALTAQLDRTPAPGSDFELARGAAMELLAATGWLADDLAGRAIQFATSCPDVASVSVGVKNVRELEDALAGLAMPPMTTEDLATIDRIAWAPHA